MRGREEEYGRMVERVSTSLQREWEERGRERRLLRPKLGPEHKDLPSWQSNSWNKLAYSVKSLSWA